VVKYKKNDELSLFYFIFHLFSHFELSTKSKYKIIYKNIEGSKTMILYNMFTTY